MDPKLEFGERLRSAMEAAGLVARPSVLLKLFNARYWGRSVTFQAASRWLRGQAIPEQDKLLVLAEILHMEPEVLRYGEGIRRTLRERQQRWDEGAGYLERETFDTFLQLPDEQRSLIRQTVLLFAKANEAEKGAPVDLPTPPRGPTQTRALTPPAANDAALARMMAAKRERASKRRGAAKG